MSCLAIDLTNVNLSVLVDINHVTSLATTCQWSCIWGVGGRGYCKEKLFRYGRKPAAGGKNVLPPTLPYVAFSALFEEEMGFSSGTNGQIRKPAAGRTNFFRKNVLPPTLPFVAFSALSEEEMGLSSGTDGQISWHVFHFSRHERACRHVKIGPGLGERH